MPALAFPLASPLGGGGGVSEVSTSAEVWAQDTIQVVFDTPIKIDANFRSNSTYVFTPLDGGQPITVVGVQVAKDVSFVKEVFIIVNSFQLGSEYQIDFMGLTLASGGEATIDPAKFIGRQTKEDSIINTRPEMYDMAPLSPYPLRGLLQAIGRQDDLIGGSRNDRIFPTPAQPVITVAVSPATATTPRGSMVQYTADVTGTPNPAVTWEVNGIPGGNATVGTITVGGLYTAPAAVPSPATVTITARSAVNTTVIGTATNLIVLQIIGWEFTTFPSQIAHLFQKKERQQPPSAAPTKRILP